MSKRLVLDTNIILRAVFGRHVFGLIEGYEDTLGFYAPDVCFEQAERYLPQIAAQRGSSLQSAKEVLTKAPICWPLLTVGSTSRLRRLLAVALPLAILTIGRLWRAAMALSCPIWTEDQDFFGTGIATWNTANIEQYLRNA